MAQASAGLHEPVRVMVVDRDPVLRRLVRHALDARFVLSEAQDGFDALDAYLEERFDIVVIGERLGSCDARQVVEYIRGQANDSRTFIVVLFWDLSPAGEFALLHAGANDCLRLPFYREVFRARMEVGLRHIRMTQQLEQAYMRIEAQMRTVADLQKKLVPSLAQEVPGFRVRHLYQPSGLASGDYYDCLSLPSGGVRVVVADVSGHGARAAFIMAMVRTVVRAGTARGASIEYLLATTNTQLLETVGDESDFVTIFLADVDPALGRLRFASAGHCPGLLRVGTQVEPLAASTPMLGFFPLEFRVEERAFPPGSGLLLYTDGLYEWEMASGEQLGVDRFVALAAEAICEPTVYLDALMHRLEEAGEMPPVFTDDVTALWVETDPTWRSVVFRVEAAPAQVRQVVRQAVEWAAEMPPEMRDAVELAVVEACANVVRYAYGEGGGVLELRVAVAPGSLVRFQVVDYGRPFDPPERWGLPEETSSSGRGLFLIHTLMDRVHYGRMEGANVLTLEKRWEGACQNCM
jgi:sigma-B regulation protein RsbU (phosphoserine phosphatase)